MTDEEAASQARKHADQAWAYTALQNVMAHKLGDGASRSEVVSFLLGASSAIANLIASTEVESNAQESAFMEGMFIENMVVAKVMAVKQLHDTMMAEAAGKPLN